MIDLSERVALVTGGGRGIGRATAQALSRVGADVAVTYASDPDAASECVEELGRGDARAVAVHLDQGDASSVREGVAEAVARLGGVDILVNNAGIWNEASAELADLDDAALDRMIDVNLKGAVRVTREVIRGMKDRRYGRVVSVGSTAGVRGEGGHSHYAAAKGALLAWSRSLTAELGPFGITANVVSPGWVLTDMTRATLEALSLADVEAGIPTRRISRPHDVAAAVVFLASDGAAQISGVNLDVNGGAVFS